MKNAGPQDDTFFLVRGFLAGPDASGEAANGGEVQIFVEPDGGAVLRGHGQRQFAEFQSAEGFGRSLHEHAAESVALIAGKDADLRGVAHSGGDFAGEHGADELVAARLTQDERSAGHELAATRQKNNVLEEAQSSGAAAVLIVNLAVDVIGVRQVNQFRARLEEAIVPAVEAHARGGAGARLVVFLQIEEHELARVELKALLAQRSVDRAAERHELCFDARKLRERAHGEKHFFQEASADVGLRKAGGDVQSAD